MKRAMSTHSRGTTLAARQRSSWLLPGLSGKKREKHESFGRCKETSALLICTPRAAGWGPPPNMEMRGKLTRGRAKDARRTLQFCPSMTIKGDPIFLDLPPFPGCVLCLLGGCDAGISRLHRLHRPERALLGRNICPNDLQGSFYQFFGVI